MKKTLALTAIAMAFAAPAFANADMTVDQVYAKYDSDKDGALNKAEFDKKMADHGKAADSSDKFSEIDANGDSKVSKAEMNDWKKDHM